MSKHLKYLRYLVRHKWYVFIECWKLGIIWQGITHDLSKFSPSEWFPYAEYFYGNKKEREWFDAYSKFGGVPELAPWGFYVSERFDLAWLKHQKRNPHHWQYWVLREDSGKTKLIPMPDKYRKEMLADWKGAGRALGKPDTINWFLKNGLKMELSVATRDWIEAQLRIRDQLDLGLAAYDRSHFIKGAAE